MITITISRWKNRNITKLPDLEEEKRGLRAMMADYAD